MKIAVVYNRESRKVINVLGLQNREKYGKKSIERITNALKAGGHQVAKFEGDKDLIDNLEGFMPRVIKGERPGMVFNLAYGVQGQARYTHVPGILEMVGLPYVGSGPMAHSLALDKVVAKMIFVQNGLPTPAFAVLETPDFAIPDVPFPQIVKPRNEAMSFGMRVVNNEDELREAAGVIFDQFQQSVLVEQYIDGREINVGLLGNSPTEALPPAELLFGSTGQKIYTVEDKRGQSGRKIDVICPAELDEGMTAQAQDIAKRAFRALGCLDCARVDMRLDDDGNFYILEINSLPSLGEHGSYVQGAEAVGLDFPKLINRLVEVASARYFGTPTPPELSDKSADPSQKIFAYITGRRDKIENRLQQWVHISSRTQDTVGLRAAWSELGRTMTRLGLAPVAEFTDGSHAATWETGGGFDGGTLLIGHLDVPLPAQAAMPAFRRDPEWLYGEGIASSRSPLVMLEMALAAVRSARKLKAAKIGVLYYSDEGEDCAESAKLIGTAMARAARVLVLRPGNQGDKVISKRRGIRRYHLRVDGDSLRVGQASRRPGAVPWLLKQLDACRALSDRKARIAVAVGELRTNTYPMLLPHEAHATLLVSFPDQAAAETTEEKLRELLTQNKGGPKSKLELLAHRPAMADRPENKKLRAELGAIAADWDIPFAEESSLLPSVAGLTPKGTAVVCGIGPSAIHAFTSQEAVQRISIVQRTLLLAAFLERVTGPGA